MNTLSRIGSALEDAELAIRQHTDLKPCDLGPDLLSTLTTWNSLTSTFRDQVAAILSKVEETSVNFLTEGKM